MGQITLDRDDAMCVLVDPDAGPDAKVVAACTVAFFEAKEHAGDVDPSTRAIALKLSHMTASAIYDGHASTDGEVSHG